MASQEKRLSRCGIRRAVLRLWHVPTISAILAEGLPHIAQVRRRHGDAELLGEVAGDEPEAETLAVQFLDHGPAQQDFFTQGRGSFAYKVLGAGLAHALKILELLRPGGAVAAPANGVEAEPAYLKQQRDVWDVVNTHARKSGRCCGACLGGICEDTRPVRLGETGEPAQRTGALICGIQSRWMCRELRHLLPHVDIDAVHAVVHNLIGHSLLCRLV